MVCPAGGHGDHIRGVGGLHRQREHQNNPAVAAAHVYSPWATWRAKRSASATHQRPVQRVYDQTSDGAVDSATDSFNPMGGFGPLSGMMLGEVTPGGTGSGLYTLLIYAIIAVFIGGLISAHA